MTIAVQEDVMLVADDILKSILPLREKKSPKVPLIPEGHIVLLLNRMKEIFANESMLLRLNAPITIVGDLHGQIFDALRILEAGGHPPKTKYLLLGDEVDRGAHSIETICLLFALKVRYPE